jgi:hypothetical protein
MVVEGLLMEGKVEGVVERPCIALEYSMKRRLKTIRRPKN